MASEYYTKFALLTLSILLSGCGREVSFADKVQPIFRASCIECHNENAAGYAASGFDLSNYDSVMRGTKFGPVVIANSSMSSTLYLVIAGKTSPEIHMPPHHDNSLAAGRGTPLSDKQVETIRLWIDQGARNN